MCVDPGFVCQTEDLGDTLMHAAVLTPGPHKPLLHLSGGGTRAPAPTQGARGNFYKYT